MAVLFVAPVLTLAVSDVHRNNPPSIASGPTAADPTPLEQALIMLRRYRIETSNAIIKALSLDGLPDVGAIACDTDGIDATEASAGALIDPTPLARAKAAGLNSIKHLDDNDAHGFFAALNDCVVTGPTLTNVSDSRAVLVL